MRRYGRSMRVHSRVRLGVRIGVVKAPRHQDDSLTERPTTACASRSSPRRTVTANAAARQHRRPSVLAGGHIAVRRWTARQRAAHGRRQQGAVSDSRRSAPFTSSSSAIVSSVGAAPTLARHNGSSAARGRRHVEGINRFDYRLPQVRRTPRSGARDMCRRSARRGRFQPRSILSSSFIAVHGQNIEHVNVSSWPILPCVRGSFTHRRSRPRGAARYPIGGAASAGHRPTMPPQRVTLGG